MEKNLREDPQNYVARPIFGHFDVRGLITVLAIVLLTAPVIWFMVLGFLDSNLGTLLVALLAGPIGLLGFGRFHGLTPEKYLPFWLAERKSPAELMWNPPYFTTEEEEEIKKKRKPTAEERKLARENAHSRNQEWLEDSLNAEAFIDSMLEG